MATNSLKYQLTTADIKTALAKAKKDYNIAGPLGQAVLDANTKQVYLERAYITNYHGCPVGATHVGNRFPTFNTAKFNELTKTQLPYNANVAKVGTCLAEALIVDRGPYAIAANDRIREYITKLRRVGDESAVGIVMAGDFSVDHKSSNLFVLKTPLEDVEENVHELVVALYATNAFRTQIPNFTYYFGSIDCSGPILDDRKTVAWCNSTKNPHVPYIMIENIAPAQTFTDFIIGGATLGEILGLYLQTMCALAVAHEKCGFTHYDLHSRNVLIRPLPNVTEFIVPYTFNGSTFYLRATRLAMIIDFGGSYVRLQDAKGEPLDFGSVGMPMTEYGIYRDRPFPMHDAYKLLCFLLNAVYSISNPTRRAPLWDGMVGLLKYFNATDSPTAIIQDQAKSFYALPWDDQIAKLTLPHWIAYVRQHMADHKLTEGFNARPRDERRKQPIVVLRCSGQCMTFSSALQMVGLNELRPIPRTMLEFQDTIGEFEFKEQELRKTSKQAADRLLASAWETVAAFQPHLVDAVRAERATLAALLPSLIDPKYKEADKSTDDEIEKTVVRSAQFLDTYQRLNVHLKAANYVHQVLSVAPGSNLADLELLIAELTKILTAANTVREALVQAIAADADMLLSTESDYAKIYADLSRLL